MKTSPEEYQTYETFLKINDLSIYELTQEQLSIILRKANLYNTWVNKHPLFHNSLNYFCLFVLLIVNFVLLTYLCVLPWDNLFFIICIAGCLRGYFSLNLQYMAIHEGLSHERFVVGSGKLKKTSDLLLDIISRLHFCDPDYVVPAHRAHHKYTSTRKDAIYGNCITPKRFWISMIPFAHLFKFCDYKYHRDERISYKKVYGDLAAIGLHTLICTIINVAHGSYWPGLVYVFLSTQLPFWINSFMGYFEHMFMVSSQIFGGRTNGDTILGYLIGCGPFGQPYHTAHHISPSLPWYFQGILNRDLKRVLNKKQKNYFITKSSWEMVRLFIRSMKNSITYSKISQGINL